MKPKEIDLTSYRPSQVEMEYWLDYWDSLDNYVAQENALDRLFGELCPRNVQIEDILIKCSTLNDFYSTNIFKVYNVASHFMSQNIDERLNIGDPTLVDDLARVTIDGKVHRFYSFASKYCSHHRPQVYPIYDSYVQKILMYFRKRDHFCKFTAADLKDYTSFTDIIKSFRSFYGLECYTIKEIDKYLWQVGKQCFNKFPQKEKK